MHKIKDVYTIYIFFEIVQYIYTFKREFYYSFKFFCFYKSEKLQKFEC